VVAPSGRGVPALRMMNVLDLSGPLAMILFTETWSSHHVGTGMTVRLPPTLYRATRMGDLVGRVKTPTVMISSERSHLNGPLFRLREDLKKILYYSINNL
jgi:hypothetical protein